MQEWLLEPERSEHVATVPPDRAAGTELSQHFTPGVPLCIEKCSASPEKSSERLLLKCDPVVFQQQNNLEDQVQSRHRDQDVALL